MKTTFIARTRAKTIRIHRPDLVYFITNRCVDEMFLMRPDPRIRALILGCLARAVEKHGVELIGFVFMANHFHLLVRAPHGNLSAFMRDFEAPLAIKLQRVHDLRGAIFPRPYRQVDLLDDATAFDKLVYLLANPCAAHLVDRPEQYPGLSSLEFLGQEGPIVGRWIDQETLTRNRRRNPAYDEERAASYHRFHLAPLPAHADLGLTEQRRRIVEALARRCDQLRRARGGRRVLGAVALRRVSPFKRPANPKFSPCPPSLATDPELLEQHREHRRRTTASYYRARRRDRDPKRRSAVRYPPGTMRPGEAVCTPFSPRALAACPLQAPAAPAGAAVGRPAKPPSDPGVRAA